MSDLSPAAAERRRLEHQALAVGAIAAVATMAWISMALSVGIFLGVLTAFTLMPLHGALLRRTGRPWLAQLACLLVAGLAISIVLFAVSATLIARGSVMASALVTALEPHGQWRTSVLRLDRRLAPLGIDLSHLIDKLRNASGSVAAYAAALATTIASKTFGGLLTLFFVLLTTQFILARGHELATEAELVLPLSPAHTRSLIAELRKVGRATLLGTVVTGLAQGLLAAAIFAVTGLPEPVFFGVATAVASLLPGVGTMLVWVPAGVYLMATGSVTSGIVLEALSLLLVIGFCDYALRPRLVGGDSTPALLTFAGLFGGVEVFGLVGLLVGPLLMSLGMAVLRLYRAELEQERSID